jgi:hypothetical protein
LRRLGCTFARFEHGDAFDEASLAALDPRPTLAIVSGLYELFGENALIERSLRALAQAVSPGGYLVYTGQPWHPQLEFIARALNNHRGDATWVMRRRSQPRWTSWSRARGSASLNSESTRWAFLPSALRSG